MEMEMEMVIFESLSMAEKSCDSCSDLSLHAEVCMAMAVQKPPNSSPSSLLEHLLDIAFARLMPRHREVEMGEAFVATFDLKDLEEMMVMLRPLNSCLSTEERHIEGHCSTNDMETEMVSQMHLES